MIRIACALILVIFLLDITASETNERIEAVEYSAQVPFSEVKLFLSQFKQAVKSKSCFSVAEFIEFPLTMNSDSHHKELWNRTAFCRYFPVLFDAKRSDIVIKQNIFDMPVGYRGLMFGNGIFWVQPVCQEYNSSKHCVKDNSYVLRLKVANFGA